MKSMHRQSFNAGYEAARSGKGWLDARQEWMTEALGNELSGGQRCARSTAFDKGYREAAGKYSNGRLASETKGVK